MADFTPNLPLAFTRYRFIHQCFKKKVKAMNPSVLYLLQLLDFFGRQSGSLLDGYYV